MSRSTFKVLFYVNGSKEKNGMVPVMGRVTINGSVAQFSCKLTMSKTLWDAKGNRAKGKSKEARDINLALDNIKAQIIRHYQRISDREAFVTAEMVRNAYQGLGCEYETLLGTFRKDCENMKKRAGKDRSLKTYIAMELAMRTVAEFLKAYYKREDMSMLELTPDFIKNFAVYLTTERNLSPTTVWQRCMWLKGVVLRAHYNGRIPRNPFIQFHISPKVKEREYLTEDELKILMEYKFKKPQLAFTRDLFVFSSLTAISFVDVQNLTTDNIVEIDGEKWILGKRHKTNVPFQVKLLEVPLQIIERYYPLQKDNSIFGEISYWNVCKDIRKVMKACGITKRISFHCSRHGFAVLALTKGMPIESVSRVLGHTRITTTQLYAKVTTEKLNKDMTAFGNKLDKVFSHVKIV